MQIIDANLLDNNKLAHFEKLAMMGVLSATVMHEVRNPLSIIKAAAELLYSSLESRGQLDGEIREEFDDIHRAVQRVDNIIRNMLELARPSQKQKERVNIMAIVQQVLAIEGRSLANSNIEVKIQFHPDCGECHGHGCSVLMNLDAMRQIVLNLIMNAIHAMPDGGTLTVSCGREDDKTSITVEDTGMGIPPEIMDKIFEPFFTTKPSGIGTGLGLPLVKAELNELGGDIEIESRVGEGTSVKVLLPFIGKT